MKIAIASLDHHDKNDIRRNARIYCQRQGNAHLGDVPVREDLRAYFSRLRRYIRKSNDLDSALLQIDIENMNMDDM